MYAWQEPLMSSPAACAGRNVQGMRFGDMHALLWSLGHGLSFGDLWRTFEAWAELDVRADVLDLGVLLMSCERRRDAEKEQQVWRRICERAPLRRDMQEIVAGATRQRVRKEAFIDKERVSLDWAGAQVARHGGHAQHKLAMLVQYVEAHFDGTASDAAEAVMQSVVDFSRQKFNYWLKVAGDAKASLIQAVLQRLSRGKAAAFPGEVRLEMGAYVGFTTLRLAQGGLVLSLEVDPLHVCVARHLLNLGRRAHLAEVCSGQVRDLLPGVLESFGEAAAGLVFMDHRGTRFHEELRLLEATRLLAVPAQLLCDNVLHPGAPVFLWRERQRVTVYSLQDCGN
ncbi:unnamed protein product [Effrenium voratum]|uniref:Methyltransferase n=1 Tax=Effrenium voratum TaxID=2562239 RepID=A0AA36MMF6_9DINO|nr:unnamed protein product [Effrenium voratum]CAJ1419217.1 unnamed protein product [Effrenium voratum]